MRFSIVLPTYNEQQDIADTLEALVGLDYPDKEILVVDDSTDATPEIVTRYADRGVRLIHPGGGGRCEARNLGIMQSTGEVVCILNADVRPRRDYLRRLAGHYARGADYVLVSARVSNREALFARYVDCLGALDYVDPHWLEWTEGFSCRRQVALRAGLFPVGFVMPICAGEDGFFGTGLRNVGAKKVIDLSIVVDHIAPASFSEYWHIRKGRGSGAAQCHRFFDQWPFAKILVWNLLKSAKTAVFGLTLLPPVVICWRASRFSERGGRDVVPFLYAWILEQAALHTGEWQTAFQIMKRERDLHPAR
jgi:glycosyltransferase involved in cell wall biosynthesis